MKQIEKFMNAMVIDYAHAATGNRVKWAFTSDTRADVVDMAVAVYRRNARRPYMIIFPQYNAIRNEINTVAAVILEGDDTRNIMEGIENVNTFKVYGSPYDNDGMSIYAPAAEQEAPADTETEQTTEEATPATEATATETPKPSNIMTEIESALDAIRTADEEIKKLGNPEHLQAKVDAINWTLPRVDWLSRISAAIDAAQGPGTPRTTAG